MFQSLTNSSQVEFAKHAISELLDLHGEWYCSYGGGSTQLLRRWEIDVAAARGRLIISCWTEQGTRSWRVLGWSCDGESLSLQTSRRAGAERNLIELIPRAAASAIAATVRAARQTRCDRIAQIACNVVGGFKIERSALSPGIRRGQPGRFARILLRHRHMRVAVTASVLSSHAGQVDAFLSSALLWFKRTADRARPPYIQQLWLIIEEHLTRPALQRIALFRENLKEVISIFAVDENLTELKPINCPERHELFRRRLPRFPPVPLTDLSDAALKIVAEAPGEIDVVHMRHGETLRYLGLPFARVRSVLGAERVWFGVEGSRRVILDSNTAADWHTLMTDLRLHRAAEAPDHRHALYRAASEAWLESILRRDISRLDPGLIIAPLHAQFRTARGGPSAVRPIDLLALRQDGRLVVIELKVFEDREHVLQGADYWQRVEAHRRRGQISKAKLFGNRRISDESPLVYLVAPTLRFHPSFSTLARCISNEVEIYRFDINEDWRARVRVMRRMRVN
jgi:hypothetical protein